MNVFNDDDGPVCDCAFRYLKISSLFAFLSHFKHNTKIEKIQVKDMSAFYIFDFAKVF